MSLPPSAVALADVLTDDRAAKRLRARVHRTALWKFKTGRRLPDLTTACVIERVTNGRVPANGWVPVSRAGVASRGAANGEG